MLLDYRIIRLSMFAQLDKSFSQPKGRCFKIFLGGSVLWRHLLLEQICVILYSNVSIFHIRSSPFIRCVCLGAVMLLDYRIIRLSMFAQLDKSFSQPKGRCFKIFLGGSVLWRHLLLEQICVILYSIHSNLYVRVGRF